jgi:ParB family chromosome partitioning protein
MGHARALINIPSESLQLKLFSKIINTGMSVRKVEQLAKSTGKISEGGSRKAAQREVSSSVQSVEEKIRQALGTKVTVREKENGRGEIVIEFYSLDDLDRLLDLFASLEKLH